MLVFKKTWTLTEDFKAGDKIDIYYDGFSATHVERHVTPEERERIRKEKRISALKAELKSLEEDE